MRESNESPWRRLRVPAVVFAVTVVAGGGAACAGWWHERKATDELEQAEERLAEARRRYADLAAAQRQRRRHELQFRRWAANGWIGVSDPERWEQAVRNASREVLSASHRTSPSRTVERHGGVEVRETDTSIELRMRHEAELPEFLAALARETGSAFSVAGCRLTRSDLEGAGATPSALVDTACRLRRRTVHLTGVGPGWLPSTAQGAGDEARGVPPRIEPVLAAAPQGALEGAFDRLFTTAEERKRIERAAIARAPEVPPPENPERSARRDVAPPRPTRWVHVNGLVARSGESLFAWVDGRRVDRDSRTDSRTASPDVTSHGVRLKAGGRWIAVRPGQRFDPATGEVSDRIGRNAVRFERAGFLPVSSLAPLRDSPDSGQNRDPGRATNGARTRVRGLPPHGPSCRGRAVPRVATPSCARPGPFDRKRTWLNTPRPG